MDWGGASLKRGEGETLTPARLATRGPPDSQQARGEASGGAHEQRVLESCHLQPLFLSVLFLLPKAGWETKLSGWLGSWGMGVRGGDGAGQGPGPRPRPQSPSWAGNPGSLCRTEQQGGTRPKPAGLYAPHTLSCGGPAPAPVLRPPAHPAPRTRTRGGTQELHQLPPLSRGPAAPRESLGGSPAAVSSSSSSSSSSPSVNSSWLRP